MTAKKKTARAKAVKRTGRKKRSSLQPKAGDLQSGEVFIPDYNIGYNAGFAAGFEAGHQKAYENQHP